MSEDEFGKTGSAQLKEGCIGDCDEDMSTFSSFLMFCLLVQ